MKVVECTTKVDNGDSAFPFVSHGGFHEHQHVAFGMSLRDWFAGQCIATMMTRWSLPCGPCKAMDDAAKSAYHMADALIKVRKETMGE